MKDRYIPAFVLLIVMIGAVLCSCGAKTTSMCDNGHTWRGNINSGIISCVICRQELTVEQIREKEGQNLADEEKACVYWWLDYYLTATDGSGKYLYSEDKAFSLVQEMFSVSRSYLDSVIWNNYETWKLYNKCYG